jgi:hypothetical protein
MREVDRKAVAGLPNAYRAVPGIRIIAGVAIEGKRWADLGRRRCSLLHFICRGVQPSQLEVVKLLGPVALRKGEIVIEQLVQQAADDLPLTLLTAI